MEWLKSLVRPTVTWALVGAVIYGFVVGLVGAEVFVPLTTLAIVFYFEKREQEKAKE